jgi:WD40 repeat protein
MENQISDVFRYEAFISYRHKDLDTAAAEAVHRGLETFRIPGHIAKALGKKRVGKIFRDRDELPLMADLDDGIKQALAQSRWLIVVCSPDMPLSKWCMAEVNYFIDAGRRDRILTLLVAGEPDESFPEQLRFVPDGEGGFTEREPLAADLRAPDLRVMKKKLRTEKLRLLAPMLGVGFDDLRRRARERFLRIVVSASLSAAVIFAAFGGFAAYQAVTISEQNAELEARKAAVYAGFSREQLYSGNRAGAALLALETMPADAKATLSQDVRNAVYSTAYGATGGRTQSNNPVQYLPAAQMPGDVVPSPDGKTFVASNAEYARIYDADDFRLICEHAGASTTINAFVSDEIEGAQVKRATYNRSGDTVFLSNGSPVFVNTRTGEIIKEGYFTDAGELADFGLSRYECVMPQSYDLRRVVDLGSVETLFDAPTEHSTSKNLFSPDGRYYIVATYVELKLFDMEQRAPIAVLPCDGVYVEQGFTFFSPDSRFLLLARETRSTVSVGEFEEARRVYDIQLLEIPSLRIVYEDSLLTDGTSSYSVLPNYGNVFDSDIPAHLFSPDGSKLLLPLSAASYGVFDLAGERMLFTKNDSIKFASFSPSGTKLLTVGRNVSSWKLRNAENGDELSDFYKADADFSSGFVSANEDTVFMVSDAANGYICGVYEAATPLENGDSGRAYTYFTDAGGRYIRPADEDTGAGGAAVIDGPDGETIAILEDSSKYTQSRLFAAAGDLVVGLSDEGTESKLKSWNAGTGKAFAAIFEMPEYCWPAASEFPQPLFLSEDAPRVAVIYQMAGVNKGGFRTFDARTGALLADVNLGWFHDSLILFDKNITKMMFVYDNEVSVFDALTGEKLFTLDDYPQGNAVMGTWSGQETSLSDDGALIAVSHSKKNTLEIIDAATGDRLHETALDESASCAPFFSRDGARVALGVGKTLLCVDTATGEEIFSVRDETGFDEAYIFSSDGLYLIGADVRDAKDGEIVCAARLEARPVWEITETEGVIAPLEKAHAVYIPSVNEALAKLRDHIRNYDFTRPEKLAFALD